MIVDLVVEAVEIKIHFENFSGILQSDYELAYAMGKMFHLLGEKVPDEFFLEKLKTEIENRVVEYSPKDYIEENLIKLIRGYRMQNQKGEGQEELFRKGYHSIV